MKSKVKKLIYSLDSCNLTQNLFVIEKSGYILLSAFFPILDLNGIHLSPVDQNSIKNHFEKNGGYIKYKEVLQHIQINKDLVDPVNSNWLFIRPTGAAHIRKTLNSGNGALS